jgi:hypothetical protein
MIVTSHQPLYMPWLGFFHKAILSDRICILDDVQFADGDYINRNKIKTPYGFKWITVPVNKKNHLHRKISEIEIVDTEWHKRHLAQILQAYSSSPYFHIYFQYLLELMEKKTYEYLVDLDMTILEFLFKELRIETEVVLSSKLNLSGKKSDLILSMCQELGAEVYISGQNGVDYLKVEDFNLANIKVAIQHYEHPIYAQAHGDFIPYLSVIDLLFNFGPKSRDIIMSGNAEVWNKLSLA